MFALACDRLPAWMSFSVCRLNEENVVYPPQIPAMKNARPPGGTSQRPSGLVSVAKNPMANEPATLEMNVPPGHVPPRVRPAWAVEYDAKIAGVYADNFGHAPIVADVRAVDYAGLPAVDWLHASPVCTRASVANAGAVESAEQVRPTATSSRSPRARPSSRARPPPLPQLP